MTSISSDPGVVRRGRVEPGALDIVPGGAPWSRHLILALGLIVAIHCVAAWLMRMPGISWGGDDAQYIALARELAQGRYGEPWNVTGATHARLPPGFPAMLALVNAFAGESLDAYLVFLLACSAASLLLLFDAVRRHLDDATAVLVTGLAAVNPALLGDAGILMAEAPFRLFLLLTIWAAARADEQPRYILLAALAAGIAALTRTAGVAVVGGLGLHWLLRRRWGAVATLAILSLPAAGWIVWTAVAPEADGRNLYLYDAFALPADLIDDDDVGPAWLHLLLRFPSNAWHYARTDIPVALGFPGLRNNPAENIAWAALVLVTVPIGFMAMLRRWRPAALVLACYAVVLMVWPWRAPRFVSPVVPLLFVALGAGVSQLAARYGRRTAMAAISALAVVFVIGSVQLTASRMSASLACDRNRPLESEACFPEDERGFLQLAFWVRDNTPDDAVFYVSKEGSFYLHAERKSVLGEPFYRSHPDSLAARLARRGVTHAATTPIGVSGLAHNRSIARACQYFDLVQRFEGQAALFAIRTGEPGDPDSEACQTTAHWIGETSLSATGR